MCDYRVDTPVLLLFFNRADTLKRVFEQVRKVKPKVLFLAQDGARGTLDSEKVAQCREIVENIDWECNVYRRYLHQNLGCDENEFTAIDWAFYHVDRLIVLEDDCLASVSFFQFCDELLEKYENDQRIQTISGFQRMEHYRECPYSYYFSMVNAGYGWATWKRVWEDARKHQGYPVLDDRYSTRVFVDSVNSIFPAYYHDIYHSILRKKNKDAMTGKHCSWEALLGQTMMSESRLSISPTKNLVANIGMTADSTHATNNLKLVPKKIRRVFEMPSYDITFPLKHPPFILRDVLYEKELEKVFPCTRKAKFFNRIEYFFRVLVYNGPKTFVQKVVSRIRRRKNEL